MFQMPAIYFYNPNKKFRGEKLYFLEIDENIFLLYVTCCYLA